MGVWEEGAPGAPTPRVVTLDRASGGRHVAVGDDLGRVRLLHYPCVVKNAPGRTAKAHGGSVAAVRFSADDEWLAAAGGADGALMMWRTSGMEAAMRSPTLEGPIR
jgi:microtubule-associated protein-like 6